MQIENFFSTICGPPLAANTAISKEVGIYHQTLSPYAVTHAYKRSSAAQHCLAVNETHVFSAQEGKAVVHVYSREKGTQEALVSFGERIRCIALAGNTLVIGTVEGRLILWETATGRQVTTPSCHVQAVSCIAATAYHILSGSEDANVDVWSLARLMELDTQSEMEPDLILSNHRGAITDVAVGPSTNHETNICVSASKDKTCIVWNYQTGQVLRTLLFSSIPTCIALDFTARGFAAATESRDFYLIDFFGNTPIIGQEATEQSSIVMQVEGPIGRVAEEFGAANCLAINGESTIMVSGHANGKIVQWALRWDRDSPEDSACAHNEIANLNASVTNLVIPNRMPAKKSMAVQTIVKPSLAARKYTHLLQVKDTYEGEEETRFSKMMNSVGFPRDVMEEAIASLEKSQAEKNGNGGINGDEPKESYNEGLLNSLADSLLGRP